MALFNVQVLPVQKTEQHASLPSIKSAQAAAEKRKPSKPGKKEREKARRNQCQQQPDAAVDCKQRALQGEQLLIPAEAHLVAQQQVLKPTPSAAQAQFDSARSQTLLRMKQQRSHVELLSSAALTPTNDQPSPAVVTTAESSVKELAAPAADTASYLSLPAQSLHQLRSARPQSHTANAGNKGQYDYQVLLTGQAHRAQCHT